MIKIHVTGSVASVQETEALYCGAQGVYSCKFSFDRSWEDFSKSAVFRVGGRTMTVLLDEDGSCVLPWELLTKANVGHSIEVGVYGVSAEEEVLTGVWDSIGTVREGTELGSDAREPSAGVYEQIMTILKKTESWIHDNAESIRAQVQRAETASTLAAKSAESASVSEQTARDAAQAASDSVSGAVLKIEKPSGSYTGNGDATQRKIYTGGIGSVVAIWGGNQISFLTANGGINCNQNAVSPIPIVQAYFRNGVIVIQTTASSVNANTINYNYQVL